MSAIALTIVGIVVCVAAHLGAEASGRGTPRAVLKAAASTGFLVVAVLASNGGRYAHLVFAGLCLSAIGDLLLLSTARRAFLAGIAAFLLAHVAYAAAFAPIARVSPPIGAVLAGVGLVVVRWLWPHLGSLRAPVVVYTAAITVMLVLAFGLASPLARLGAASFYLSDLTVARDRFVRPGLANRVVGLPLYYAGQVLLALSMHSAP